MASALIDNVIAARLLYMLVTPFDHTDAFKYGIIDAKGKLLKHAKDLRTSSERDSYSYLTRLVFNIKRLINKLPGGESNLKNLVAAYYFVKEKYETKTTFVSEQQFNNLVHRLDKITLVEEEILIEKLMNMIKEDGVAAVANVTGAAVSTDQPKIDKKNIKKYQIMARRKSVNVPA
jgi:site-specific DNA-adenine methylase